MPLKNWHVALYLIKKIKKLKAIKKKEKEEGATPSLASCDLGSIWVCDFKKCDFKIAILKCEI